MSPNLYTIVRLKEYGSEMARNGTALYVNSGICGQIRIGYQNK